VTRRLTLEELESRQLLSAELVPLPVEPATPASSLLGDAVVSALITSQPADAAALLAERYEVVFVDPRVPDRDTLIADLTRSSESSRRLEIIVLDANRDGIVQVTEALADRMQIDAVHFITHGTDGAVQLGGSWLNAKSLAANIDAVASWGHALKEDGDLLFYGCDLAATARGRALVEWIAEVTRTDVAASVDTTGAAVLGGNWTLEFAAGRIEAKIAVSAGEQGAWAHVLAVPTYVGNGVLASGTGTIAPALPAGLQAGDLLLAVFESQADQAVTINNPNGGTWTLLSNPNVGGSGNNSTRLTVYWSVYNGAQGNPTTNDPGNHVSGFIAAFRGVNTDDPFDVTSESTGNSASASISGATTTVRDTLVVIVASSDDDADTFGDWANTGLTGMTERYELGHTAGSDGLISMATGGKATAGAYAASTSTIAGNTRWAGMAIALAPDVLAFDDTAATDENAVLTVNTPGVLANDINNSRPPVLPGAYVNYDAATDTGGDAAWTDDTLRANWDWAFAGSVTPVTPVTSYPGITSAYDFPASGSGATLASFDASGDDDEDATWEIWFKASDLIDQYVLFESGGTTDGVSIFLREADTDGLYDDLTFAIKDGGASAFVTADLSATIGDAAAITSEFVQVVAVYNRNASVNQDILTLYVNGVATGVTTTQGNQNFLNDWSNGDGAGLGGVNSQINATSVPALGGAVGDYKNFNGQIAQFRFYNNKAFNATEAAQNFSAVADGLAVTEVNGDSGAIGSPLTLPSGAIVTVNADGSYTYDPNGAFDSLAEGQSTTDTFSYTTSGTTGVTDTATVTITIDGLNDAPVLDTSKSPALDPIAEDAAAPAGAVGTLVSALVDFADPAGELDNVTDPDTGAQLGIAIIAADSTNGTWYYSTNGGATWDLMGAVSATSARLLAADARLYFQPNPDFNGAIAAAITLRAWDRTSGANGALADPGAGGGTSAFSSTSDTASISVTQVNDPATFGGDTSGSGAEDGGPISGTLTASDAADGMSAPNFRIEGGDGPANGSAAIDAATGAWSYTPNADFNGADSFTVSVTDDDGNVETRVISITVNAVNDAPTRTAGAVDDLTVLEDSGTTSLGLAALAYSPGPPDEVGQALTYVVTAVPPAALGDIVLADGTTVVTASTAYSLAQLQGMQFRTATNANGGPATFSWTVSDSGGVGNGGVDTITESLAITVTAVNDAPTRTVGTADDLIILEDSGTTSLGLGALAYSPGPADEAGQTLTYTVTAVPAAALGDVVLADGTTVVTASTPYTLAELQGMQFRTAADANGGPATVSWTVSDSGGVANGGVDTLTESLAITVTAVNDPPTDLALDNATVAENAAGAVIGNVTVTDPDAGGSHTYSVDDARFEVVAGQLKLVAGQSLDFETEPSVDVTITATDQGGLTYDETFTITVTNVNEAPVLDGAGGTLAYSAGDGPQVIDASLTLTDIDDTNIESATVSINSGFVNSEDVLAFVDVFNITGSWSAVNGVLTLSGTDTLANYRAALETITYENTSATPNTADRTIAWVVNDGDDDSAPVTSTITVASGNTTPTTSGIADVTVDEDDPDTVIDLFAAFADVEDPDSALTYTVVANTNPALFSSTAVNGVAGTLTLDYAPNAFGTADLTVRATDSGGLFVETTFSVTVNQVNDPATFGGDTSGSGAEDGGPITGTLTASDAADGMTNPNFRIEAGDGPANGSASINATAGAWSYTPNADFNGNDSFTVSVTDDDGNVETQLITISVTAVNDAPVLGGAGGTLAYSAGDGPQVIDSSLTLSDVDDTNIESATVSISANYVNGEDVLAFADTPNITGSWNAATGVLTLSGTDTLANYRAALESITYENTSATPSTADRTITWLVNDGDDDSAPVTSTVVFVGGGTGGAPLDRLDDGELAESPSVLPSDPDASTLFRSTVVSEQGSVADSDRDVAAPSAGSLTQPIPRMFFGRLVPPSIYEEVSADAPPATANSEPAPRRIPPVAVLSGDTLGSPVLGALHPELEKKTFPAAGAAPTEPTVLERAAAVRTSTEDAILAKADPQAPEPDIAPRHPPTEIESGSGLRDAAQWAAGGLLGGLIFLWVARRTGLLATVLSALPAARLFGPVPARRDEEAEDERPSDDDRSTR